MVKNREPNRNRFVPYKKKLYRACAVIVIIHSAKSSNFSYIETTLPHLLLSVLFQDKLHVFQKKKTFI